MSLKSHVELLGHRVRDRVTKMEGTVTSISFDLYGCVQAIINPGKDKDGKLMECVWFDVNRLEVISKVPVMPLPEFPTATTTVTAPALKGPESKPIPRG